jgi:shikimate kinase
LVESKGWRNFRNLEQKAVEAIKDEMEVVIDCGGGVVENTQNMSVLAKQSLVIWIDADLEDILLRLSKDKNRPLLDQQNLEEDVKNNYHRRFPLYQFYAHYTYNSSRKSVDQICHFIQDRLMKR